MLKILEKLSEADSQEITLSKLHWGKTHSRVIRMIKRLFWSLYSSALMSKTKCLAVLHFPKYYQASKQDTRKWKLRKGCIRIQICFYVKNKNNIQMPFKGLLNIIFMIILETLGLLVFICLSVNFLTLIPQFLNLTWKKMAK